MPAPAWLAHLPLAGQQLMEWWNANLADPKAASQWLERVNMDNVTAWTRTLGGEVLHRLFLFFITLLALFFLLRDGAWVAARVLDTADRVLGDPGERLASKMVEAVSGTVTGTMVVAVVEGALIGVAYVLAGVPAPFLFAFLTAAFAMLPFGAWVAFTSAALLLLVQGGSGLAALGVFGWGALVMFIGDHFVWPKLVGSAARLPFLFALIGIFGGIASVRAARAVPRAGDHGRLPDRLARMAGAPRPARNRRAAKTPGCGGGALTVGCARLPGRGPNQLWHCSRA